MSPFEVCPAENGREPNTRGVGVQEPSPPNLAKRVDFADFGPILSNFLFAKSAAMAPGFARFHKTAPNLASLYQNPRNKNQKRPITHT